MDKMCWVWVMVLVAASLMVIPSAGAETVEREWWEANKDHVFVGKEDTFTGGFRYLRVNTSDVLTVNWKSGNFTTFPPYLYICIYASSVVNYSGLNDPYNNFNQQVVFYPYNFYIRNTSAPPKSCWIRFGSDQVVKVEWYGFGVWNITVNFTVTPGEETLTSRVAKLEAQVAQLSGGLAELNFTVSNLSANLSSLESSLGDLRAHVVRTREMLAELNASLSGMIMGLKDGQTQLHENLTYLQSAISNLREEVEWLRLCETANYQAIQEQLAALNSSLLEALGALRGVMELSDAGLWGEVAELQGKTTPEPEQYDDSALWAELEQLRGNVSVVYNNTMVNDTTVQQPVMYVNRTTVGERDGSAVVGGAAAGFVGGAVAAGVSVTLYDRRMKRRYGGVAVPPADKI